jgi:Coenzyme A transferase
MTGRDKVIGVDEAIATIVSGDTIVTGGFVGSGFPEHLAVALEQRFLQTGAPADLDLIFAAGQGDGRSRGLNQFAHRGMVRRVVGGHWALAPGLGRLALEEQIDAYCLPLGLISQWFRDVAAGRPGSADRDRAAHLRGSGGWTAADSMREARAMSSSSSRSGDRSACSCHDGGSTSPSYGARPPIPRAR